MIEFPYVVFIQLDTQNICPVAGFYDRPDAERYIKQENADEDVKYTYLIWMNK